jgi:hypothetical protein
MISRPKARRRGLTLPLLPDECAKNLDPKPSRWRGLLSTLGASRRNTGKQVVQTTFDQHHSSLSKLPLELRQMIWKEVLGSGIMHITHLENRLGHARCTDETGNNWVMSRHDCWGRGCCLSASRRDPSLYVGPIYGVEEPQSLLGLVMSCRAL